MCGGGGGGVLLNFNSPRLNLKCEPPEPRSEAAAKELRLPGCVHAGDVIYLSGLG